MNNDAILAVQPVPPLANESNLWRWVATVDHKDIGILYLVTSLVFFRRRAGITLDPRPARDAERKGPRPQTYNEIFTMHGTTMIFLVVMPLLMGSPIIWCR